MTDTVTTRYAGTRVPRVEDNRLLTGRGTFVDDITRPGMLHACFVRSPFAHATINGIDAQRPSRCPVCARCSPPPTSTPMSRRRGTRSPARTSPDTPRPPLAEGEVKFVGDPVALVVADNRYIAEDAIELVEVDYEPLPAIADFTKAVNSDVVVHEAYPDNVAGGMGGAPPDEETFSTAAHVAEANVYQQIYAPVPMETRGMVVEWDASSRGADAVGVHADPARVAGVRRTPAGHPGSGRACHHARHRRRFRPEGRPDARGHVHHARRAQSARAMKWIEDRRENLMSAGQARHVDGKARMAFDDDGNILAADIDFTYDIGAYPTPYPVLTTAAVGMFFPGPYRVPKASFNYKTVFSTPRALRPTAVHGSTKPYARNPSRHRRTQDGHGPCRAAAPKHPARRRDAVLQRERHALRPCRACGHLRAGGENP